MKRLFIILFLFNVSFAFAAKPKNYYVRINSAGKEAIVKLYNETPQHRDNFVKLVKKGFFDGTLFHRVIKNFMIQGGDPDSKNAKPNQVLGDGGLNYTVPAEFNAELFHKKGVLAAARDENPAKASSSTQFYLVQGKVFTDKELNTLEQTRLKGRKIPENQRQVYKTIGGTPHLDQSYTVFGEIVKGLELVDDIAAVKTGANDRPVTDVPMKITLLKKREVRRLEKELIKASFKNSLIMNAR
jgi:peptidyl-prolyl cis-trans isomerase B (cyclophilin B)